jgi:lincosamide nucleotidyltransferase B/F
VAYYFPNTEDGYKLLFADGIFCEFAVFEPDELEAVPFANGRIVWKRPLVAGTIAQSLNRSGNQTKRSQEWLLGEALTNLYVGLGRERRGERLSALRFIQGYAVDCLLELIEQTEEAQPVTRDVFAPERRFEQRYREAARQTPLWLQGYEYNQASALAILSFLEERFVVNQAIAAAIRKLCV